MAIECSSSDNAGSLALNRSNTTVSGANNSFRVRSYSSSLSRASFRKRLFEVIACGGGGGGSASRSSRNGGKCKRRETDSGDAAIGSENRGSEKLADFLNIPRGGETRPESERRRKRKEAEEVEEAVEDEMRRVVERLGMDEKEKVMDAAREVRRLAKDDSTARSSLAMLGAIQPLIGMLDCENDDDLKIAALYAILNLAIGNDLNKAAIVKAGAVHKMLNLIESQEGCLGSEVCEAIVVNFLGLSALDSNKQIIGSSGAIQFLVMVLKNGDRECSAQARQDSLRALYNLTICHSNISFVLETDLIGYLMSVTGNVEVSERGLAILSNVVSTPEGRKAISAVPKTFYILVDVLSWSDEPGCQEKATYILMVMAHKAYGDRRAMVEAGVVSALLELTLIGTTLAQKRASRVLECLRVDKGKQVSQSFSNVNVSAPLYGPSSSASYGLHSTSSESPDKDNAADNSSSTEKNAVKQLVRQSLQNNMRRIVKRANLPNDYVPSDHFKSLTISSTSKSLPF